MNLSACGIDCDSCKHREQNGCTGCHALRGKVFWGECDLYNCSAGRGHDGCGKCGEFPCEKLCEWATQEGDNRIENLRQQAWHNLFNRRKKLVMSDIRAFMQRETFVLFTEFARVLRDRYGLGYISPRYAATHGWTYSYGRSGYICINPVTFAADSFTVCDLTVGDNDGLNAALQKVDEVYNNGFGQRFAAYAADRTGRRKARAMSKPSPYDGEAEFKRSCTWPPKVSRSDLLRLYKGDVNGLRDDDLLEDVGLTLYVRCKESKEIYDMMETGRIKCRHCGRVHLCTAMADVVDCDCGKRYTYHSYRKSFREDNMPRGAASAIFDAFVTAWDTAKTHNDKMRIVDNLIHEFHVSILSGNRGRPVGINLIRGTRAQIVELINRLAYD